MPPSSNPISKSLLVCETLNYLESLGGRAPCVNVVDYVMKINRPEPGLARLLMLDLVQRDPRITVVEDMVELVLSDHAAIRLEETGFVVFDLETTGAKAPPCRITEIGAYKVKNCEIAAEFHSLVNPEVPIPPFITSLTGISDAMVADAPRFCDVVDDFLDFVGDSVLVAHNASFDMRFLNYEIGRVYEDYHVANPSLCTVQLSRRLLPNIENHKLNTVAAHYAIELLNHHRACDDARATARIFVNLLKELYLRGVFDLGSARNFASRSSYVRRSKATT